MSLHGYDLPRGKVECDWPHDAELQNAYKRIAELEAEVDRLRNRRYPDSQCRDACIQERKEASP